MPPDDPGAAGDRDGGLDELFAALAHRRRRQVLRYFLEEEEETAALEELARLIAERDRASAAKTAVAVELHHADLPKLEAAGVIEYDDQDKVVRYRPGDRLDELWAAVAPDETSRDPAPSSDR